MVGILLVLVDSLHEVDNLLVVDNFLVEDILVVDSLVEVVHQGMQLEDSLEVGRVAQAVSMVVVAAVGKLVLWLILGKEKKITHVIILMINQNMLHFKVNYPTRCRLA